MANEPIELKPYVVSWRLPASGFKTTFTVTGEFTSPIDAAERLFLVANGQDPDSADGRRWERMQHRSLSVGDHISVNGEPWRCESAGWRPSMETDPRCMEEHLASQYGIEIPFE